MSKITDAAVAAMLPVQDAQHEPAPTMYARREPSGLVALRQVRYSAQLAAGTEHPHDVCAIARDEAELRSMCEKHWPDADYSQLAAPTLATAMREMVLTDAARGIAATPPGLVITLRRMQREVGAPRNGKPGYRWAPGYIVVKPDGTEEYPPVDFDDARRRVHELGGTSWKIV